MALAAAQQLIFHNPPNPYVSHGGFALVCGPVPGFIIAN